MTLFHGPVILPCISVLSWYMNALVYNMSETLSSYSKLSWFSEFALLHQERCIIMIMFGLQVGFGLMFDKGKKQSSALSCDSSCFEWEFLSDCAFS